MCKIIIIYKVNVIHIKLLIYEILKLSSGEITLDIGEDRILLESIQRGYLFDKFVNYQLNQDRARAIFDKTNKVFKQRYKWSDVDILIVFVILAFLLTQMLQLRIPVTSNKA